MAATERITMTMRELDRYKVIQDVADGVLTPWRAAERLGLTTRQIGSLVGRLREHGPQGLVSGRRAMASANGELVTLYREIRRYILDLQKEPG